MSSKVLSVPLHDRGTVKPDSAEEKTPGGIFIPDTAKEKPQRGSVIAVGLEEAQPPMPAGIGMDY